MKKNSVIQEGVKLGLVMYQVDINWSAGERLVLVIPASGVPSMAVKVPMCAER